MLTAKEAGKLTHENLDRLIKEYWITIEDSVIRATHEGVNIITVKYDLPFPPDDFVDKLKELGYSVSEGMDDLEIEWDVF